MARSLIQRRQEAERTRIEAYDASLRRVSQQARPAPNFQQALHEAEHGFANAVVREASAWRPQRKTRDAARLRLAAARHLFARYPVARHLERIWIDASGLAADEVVLRKRWYIVAAGGGSLFREGAGAWLSRREVHVFLNPPGDLGFEAAFWHAIARSYACDPGMALRIARTKVAQVPRAETAYWRDAVRFFCANPTTGERIDDLVDFLADRRRNPAFSLKGRTLASLERQMREWHRDVEAIARIEEMRRRVERAQARARGQAVPDATATGATWPGAAIADWSWSPSIKDGGKREEYVVKQLRKAAELVEETRAMQHCVATYAAKCIAGYCSIWSLSRRSNGGSQRLLTIELDSQRRAVQVRGFANRPAHPDERKLLERWGKARGIDLL